MKRAAEGSVESEAKRAKAEETDEVPAELWALVLKEVAAGGRPRDVVAFAGTCLDFRGLVSSLRIEIPRRDSGGSLTALCNELIELVPMYVLNKTCWQRSAHRIVSKMAVMYDNAADKAFRNGAELLDKFRTERGKCTVLLATALKEHGNAKLATDTLHCALLHGHTLVYSVIHVFVRALNFVDRPEPTAAELELLLACLPYSAETVLRCEAGRKAFPAVVACQSGLESSWIVEAAAKYGLLDILTVWTKCDSDYYDALKTLIKHRDAADVRAWLDTADFQYDAHCALFLAFEHDKPSTLEVLLQRFKPTHDDLDAVYDNLSSFNLDISWDAAAAVYRYFRPSQKKTE